MGKTKASVNPTGKKISTKPMSITSPVGMACGGAMKAGSRKVGR